MIIPSTVATSNLIFGLPCPSYTHELLDFLTVASI